jgi:uncharacterized protein YjbI with pentapeptide repeats
LYESGLITRNGVIVDLTGADLSRANLSSADLSSANLSSADLNNARLYDMQDDPRINDAGLRLYDPHYAVSEFAPAAGADLRWANLTGADLTAATLTQEQLDRAYSLEDATLPDHVL